MRTVDGEGVVAFVPVKPIEDDQGFMWVSGIPNGARIIVQGQDFVREGQRVDAVGGATASSAARHDVTAAGHERSGTRRSKAARPMREPSATIVSLRVASPMIDPSSARG